MKSLTLAAGLMFATSVLAAPSVVPDLLPRLVGMSLFTFEEGFGQPARPCSFGTTVLCSYDTGQGRLAVIYREGRVEKITWFVSKGTKAIAVDALRLGGACASKEVDRDTGSDVLRGCPGRLAVDLGNLKSGDMFSLTVWREP